MKNDLLRLLTTALSMVALGASVFAIWSVRDLRNSSVLLPIPTVPTVISSSPNSIGFLPPGSEHESQSYPYDNAPNLSDTIHSIVTEIPAQGIPNDMPYSYSSGATTSMLISSGGLDISKNAASDDIIAFINDELTYYNTSLEFKFSLPSKNKSLRIDNREVAARKSDAIFWLWFTKDGGTASATFFVTATTTLSTDNLYFDYNLIDYPIFEKTISRATVTVANETALEETVTYQSNNLDYPNIWRFVHVIRDGKLYTFAAQIGPSQVIHIDEATMMLNSFKQSFRLF